MFCPICKAEYRPGFTHCSDCNAELVSELLSDRPKEVHDMVTLYSPNSEIELAMIKSLLDAERVNYFVKNENFGSMEVGPQIALFNRRIIMVQDNQLENASTLINDYLKETAGKEDEPGQAYSLFDKIRMAIEILLFGWLIPGKKRRKYRDDEN